MKISNKLYDVLKWIDLVALPAISSLYFAIAKIWNLPYAAEVVGTISVIATLLGTFLGISTSTYEGDGQLLVDTSREDKDVMRLDFNIDPMQVGTRKMFALKVVPSASLESTESDK